MLQAGFWLLITAYFFVVHGAYCLVFSYFDLAGVGLDKDHLACLQ
jgi:hypothetical protein